MLKFFLSHVFTDFKFKSNLLMIKKRISKEIQTKQIFNSFSLIFLFFTLHFIHSVMDTTKDQANKYKLKPKYGGVDQLQQLFKYSFSVHHIMNQ